MECVKWQNFDNKEVVNLISVVKNEIDILPAFLRHYRSIGVNQFYFVDSGSVDGTKEYLLQQEGVILYATEGGYGQVNAGLDWVNEIGQKHCAGQWTVVADADEFLWFDYLSGINTLWDLAEKMADEIAVGLFTPLVDFYSTKLKDQIVSLATLEELVQNTPRYDAFENCEVTAKSDFPFFHISSLTRGKISGRHNYKIKTYKIPFVFWQLGFKFHRSTHISTPISLSDDPALLLHFKYRQGMAHRLSRDLKTMDRQNSDVYRVTKDILNNADKIPDCTRQISRLSDLKKTTWTNPQEFRQLWRQSNKTKKYFFEIVTAAALPSNAALSANLERLINSRSWRYTRPIRKFLHAKRIIRHDQFPDESREIRDPLEQTIAIYESIWWYLLGIIRLPIMLYLGFKWYKLFRSATRFFRK